VDELGACPAALPQDGRRDGLNRGSHGGRVCWAVEGTPCSRTHAGEPRSSQSRFLDCSKCPVLKRVQDEEGPDFDFGL